MTKSLLPMTSSCSMHCFRCNSLVSLESILSEKVAGCVVDSVHCPTCASCISLKVDGVKKTLEEVLEDRSKAEGWYSMTERNEILAHYVLSQIVYRRCEGAQVERNECEFDLPDDSDAVRLLWKDGIAVGFYTLKPKGTYIEQSQSLYEMVTLDTAYIRKDCRRAGLGLSILQDIHKHHPYEDIGFSSPIAIPMLKVIEKFLKLQPEMKYRLWEITEPGLEGSKKLVWFTMARKSGRSSPGGRQRGRAL